MQSFQLIFALSIAIVLEFTCAANFEWQPEVDVEIPANAAVHPPNALRRAQATTDFSSTGSASSATTSSSASSTTGTEPPTTIMVLLPDNLATSYSGSGSVMFFDGSVGDDKSESKSAGSDTVGDEATNSASGRNVGVATTLTALTVLFGLVMA